MGFVIGFLTLVLVLICVVLIFLVLLQLPKKEAGAGLAFGGAATDALFGAGSGNVLTRITKWCATSFFVLAVLLGIMQSRLTKSSSDFQKRLENPTPLPAATATTPSTPAPATPTKAGPALTSTNLLSTPAAEDAKLPPAAAASNAAPAVPKK